MLEIIRSVSRFPFAAVMEIYSGSNGELARRQWPELPPEQGLYRAEQEMYDFLRYDFFPRQDAFCALWREGIYRSALCAWNGGGMDGCWKGWRPGRTSGERAMPGSFWKRYFPG